MKKYLLLLLFLIPFVVHADTTYKVYLDSNNNITVKEGINVVSNYSSLLTWNNQVLTIKEGVSIDYLEYYKSFTLTSDNKPVNLGTIKEYSATASPSYHAKVVIHDFVIPEDTSLQFTVDSMYSEFDIYNVNISNGGGIHNKDTSDNIGYGVTIKDSILSLGQLDPSGPIILENVDFTPTPNGCKIHSESDYVVLNNVKMNKGSIYTEGRDGHIDIIDSELTDLSMILPYYNGSDLTTDHSLYIKNSNITTQYIGNQGYTSNSIIEDSNIVLNSIIICDYLYVKNSSINIPSGSGAQLNGFDIDNSTFICETRFYPNAISERGSFVRNSILKANTIGSVYDELTIDNSYFVVNSSISTLEGITIKNSYFYMDDTKANYGTLLNVKKDLLINNSYFYIESFNDRDALLVKGRITIDDGLFFTDKDKTRLKSLLQHYIDDDSPEYNYDYYLLTYDNDTTSKSAMLMSSATVTFRVKNGTWKDGTTDDIVITKNVWEKLTEEELNKILNNVLDGSWDVIPNTEDYIKGDIVYTFNVSKVKGVTENPKTGLINYSLLIMLLLAITSYIYSKLIKKSYF